MTLEFNKNLKFKIEPKRLPDGHRAHNPLMQCVVDATLPELNKLCKNCRFCGLSEFSRQATELGIHGYMSNAENDAGGLAALNPTTRNISAGIDERKPSTIILERGKRYVCRNRDNGKEGIYIVGAVMPACSRDKPRAKEKLE